MSQLYVLLDILTASGITVKVKGSSSHSEEKNRLLNNNCISIFCPNTYTFITFKLISLLLLDKGQHGVDYIKHKSFKPLRKDRESVPADTWIIKICSHVAF